jgi:hypothetical protein
VCVWICMVSHNTKFCMVSHHTKWLNHEIFTDFVQQGCKIPQHFSEFRRGSHQISD